MTGNGAMAMALILSGSLQPRRPTWLQENGFQYSAEYSAEYSAKYSALQNIVQNTAQSTVQDTV